MIKTPLYLNLCLLLFPILLNAQTIVITHPKSLKVTSSPVQIKGAVMDFDISEIEIASVNLLELVREETTGQRKKTKKTSWMDTLNFESVPVKNGLFQKSIELKEGINSIIVKLPESKPTPENIEMKVIVLDKVSDNIEIIEPKSDRIPYLKKISGKILKAPPKSIKITIEALVPDGGNYRIDKLLEVSTPVKNKFFSIPVSIEEMLTGDEIVIITISADGIEVTKTLF